MKKIVYSVIFVFSGAGLFAQTNNTLPSDDPSFIAPASNVTSTVSSSPIVKSLSISESGVACDGGTDTLIASGNCSNYWTSDALGTNIISTNDTLVTGFLGNDTTFYANTVSSALAYQMALAGSASGYTGNVRGYFFTAPTDFVITGLYVPTFVSTENQNVALLLFDNQTAPPAYSSTTNAFTTLGYWTNYSPTDTIRVCIQVFAGDVIGVLGCRGTTNAYSTGTYTTSINGNNMVLERLGMQFPLGTTAPQDVWTETGGSISLVEMFYDLSAASSITPVNVTVPMSSYTSNTMDICAGDSVMVGGTYQTASGIYVDTLATMMGCDSIISTTLTVNALPAINFSSDTLCTQDGVVALNATPAGGSYAGTGVSGSSFDAGTGAGTYSITYDYTDGMGCNNTATANMVVQDCAAIGELELSGVRVYPNPASEYLQIALPENMQAAARLHDANGKLIGEWTLNQNVNTLQVASLSQGVYVLEIRSGEKVNQYRFIKQ